MRRETALKLSTGTLRWAIKIGESLDGEGSQVEIHAKCKRGDGRLTPCHSLRGRRTNPKTGDVCTRYTGHTKRRSTRGLSL